MKGSKRWNSRRQAEQDRVLTAVAGGTGYGYDLWKETGLRVGRLYPALQKLEREGLIEGNFMPLAPGRQHRRRRYTLTGAGRARLDG